MRPPATTRVFYTSKLDGKDVIDNFDGDPAGGGQDVLNFDALFDTLALCPAFGAEHM